VQSRAVLVGMNTVQAVLVGISAIQTIIEYSPSCVGGDEYSPRCVGRDECNRTELSFNRIAQITTYILDIYLFLPFSFTITDVSRCRDAVVCRYAS